MKKPTFKFALPTLKLPETVTSFIKPEPQPVFHRPLNTEREYRISRAVHLILLSAMVCLSMAVIGLKSMTLAFIEDNSDSTFTFIPTPRRNRGSKNSTIAAPTNTEPTMLAALPRNLYTAPAKLALVASVVALCIGIAHILLIAMDWKDGKRTQSYAFRRNTMFLHFSNSIVVLFSLVSILITHNSTSHFREGYISRKAASPSSFPKDAQTTEGISYNIGKFDLETWSCELRNFSGARAVWSEYENQCRVEMAGRILVVPLVAAAFLIAGACIAQMMRCRRDADGQRMKTEDVGMEMGKFENNAF